MNQNEIKEDNFAEFMSRVKSYYLVVDKNTAAPLSSVDGRFHFYSLKKHGERFLGLFSSERLCLAPIPIEKIEKLILSSGRTDGAPEVEPGNCPYEVRENRNGALCIMLTDFNVVVAEFAKGTNVDAKKIGQYLAAAPHAQLISQPTEVFLWVDAKQEPPPDGWEGQYRVDGRSELGVKRQVLSAMKLFPKLTVEWQKRAITAAPAKLSAAISLLEKYEAWDAEIVANDDCWPRTGNCPAMTEELHEKWVALKDERNIVLGREGDAPQRPAPADHKPLTEKERKLVLFKLEAHGETTALAEKIHHRDVRNDRFWELTEAYLKAGRELMKFIEDK